MVLDLDSNYNYNTEIITKIKVYNKHLMTGHKGNSEFCFPETLNVPRGEAEGNIEVETVLKLLWPL